MSEKSNTVKWVVLGCGGAIVLLAVFIAVLFLVVMKATAKPEGVVKDFLECAATQKIEEAYNYFSVPLKEVQSFETFEAIVKNNPSIFHVVDTTFTTRSVDLNEARFSGTLTIEAGTKVPASFRLVKENDTWKLISYKISSGE
jgi:hypothetical protein